MRIFADVRCLQDPCYAARGVGSHSASLLIAARSEAGGAAEIIGLIDPALPALSVEHRLLCDAVQTAFTADVDTPSIFLALSPMTYDTLQAARLLDRPHVLPVAILYDFIPAEQSDRYLREPSSLFTYVAALKWLEGYRVFFPISNHVGTEAIWRLGISPRQSIVTGVALRPAFERLATGEHSGGGRLASDDAYVLFVGGGDPRKNLDTVVDAFSRLPRDVRDGARLVIGGGYPEDWQHRIRDQWGSGLAAEAIHFLDHVSDEELAGWYRGARVTVVASHAEGFSMPVVEAVACGSPVLVSDIPVHRELVATAAQRFNPFDAAELATKLDRALRVDQPPAAEARETARRFTAAAVGQRFWRGLAAAFEDHLTTRPRPPRSRRKRIAFVTPFPPDRSGVADYSASTVAALGRIADVDVYTDQPQPGTAAGVRTFYPVTAAAWLRPDYDAVVAVIGNSHFHTKIIELHRRFGGPCIIHDNRLAEVTAATKGLDYLRGLAQTFLGHDVSLEQAQNWLSNPGLLPAPFYDDVLPRACPLIVHSRGIQATVQRLYGIEAEYLPFSIYRQFVDGCRHAENRAAARSRLRIPADRQMLVTFGMVDRVKAPETCVAALGLLGRRGYGSHLYFVGECPAETRTYLEKLATASGVSGCLHFMDHWLSEDEYRDYLVAADAGVQLRNHFFGGLSGALLDCVAAGLPTVANADLATSVGTPPYVVQVPDRPAADALAKAWEHILRQRDNDEEISRQRAAFAAEHSFDNYVQRLIDILFSARADRLAG